MRTLQFLAPADDGRIAWYVHRPTDSDRSGLVLRQIPEHASVEVLRGDGVHEVVHTGNVICTFPVEKTWGHPSSFKEGE